MVEFDYFLLYEEEEKKEKEEEEEKERERRRRRRKARIKKESNEIYYLKVSKRIAEQQEKPRGT